MNARNILIKIGLFLMVSSPISAFELGVPGGMFSLVDTRSIIFLADRVEVEDYNEESGHIEKIDIPVEYETRNKLQFIRFTGSADKIFPSYEGRDDVMWLMLGGGGIGFAYDSADSLEPIDLLGRSRYDFMSLPEFTATSFLTEGNIKYPPANLNDYNLKTPWVEGVDGPGIGEIISIKPSRPDSSCINVYKGILISIGYVSYDKPHLYEYNNRPSRIRLFNDETDFIVELNDSPDPVHIDLNGEFESINLEILDVYKGSKWDDTCINFIMVYSKLIVKEEPIVIQVF